MKKLTKDICFTGLGIALYVALSLCLQVPVFENYYICLGYVVMLAYCYLFGGISGATVGGIGCLLYCVLTNGLRGLPGWMLGNVIIGLALGIIFHYTKKLKNKAPLVAKIIEIVSIVIVTAIGILLVKSTVEMALYAQPFFIRAMKNMYAFIADAVVLVVSLPICYTLHNYVKRRSTSMTKAT